MFHTAQRLSTFSKPGSLHTTPLALVWSYGLLWNSSRHGDLDKTIRNALHRFLASNPAFLMENLTVKRVVPSATATCLEHPFATLASLSGLHSDGKLEHEKELCRVLAQTSSNVHEL
jgi:hypothetical protein